MLKWPSVRERPRAVARPRRAGGLRACQSGEARRLRRMAQRTFRWKVWQKAEEVSLGARRASLGWRRARR